MSDFLTNLALRSMGLAETIRPRVPSVFELYRIGSKLTVASGFFADDRDEEVFQQGASASGAQASTDHQRRERRPSVSDLPSRDFGKPETIKAGAGNQTGGITVSSPSESLFHRTLLRSHSPLHERHTPISQPKSSLIPEFSGAQSLPRLSNLQRNTIGSTIIPSGSESKSTDGMKGLRRDQHSLPLERKPTFSHSQPNSQRPPTSQTVLPTASITHPASKVSRTIEPPPGLSQPVTGFAAAPRSNSTEPVIRVTIGRVDVRAVFSNAPVRHAQPAQSRRAITLDEYLKRPSRGRR